MSRKKITLPTDLVDDWTAKAEKLGYGLHGRNKLLRQMIEVADEMPKLKRKIGFLLKG